MNNRKARYPAATLAFYGPTDRVASKAVVGIMRGEGNDIDLIHKWITASGDIRRDQKVAPSAHTSELLNRLVPPE
jgi:hypothetical protein